MHSTRLWDIFIELAPDEEEKQLLRKQHSAMALSRDQIYLRRCY